MKTNLLCLFLLGITMNVVSVSTVAAAEPPRLLEIWASGGIGGVVGRGERGVDLYQWASGGAAGFEAGIRVLFIAAYLEYLRAFGGEAGANLWSINIGGDSPIPLSEHWALNIRLAGAYYFGNVDNNRNQVVEGIPYNSDAVNTKGFGVRFGVGPRYTFARFLSVGVTPQIGYHYLYRGSDTDVPGLDQNSSGWDFQALAYLRFGIGI